MLEGEEGEWRFTVGVENFKNRERPIKSQNKTFSEVYLSMIRELMKKGMKTMKYFLKTY